MNVITSSGWMASRLLVLTTVEEAIDLLRDAQLIPQTETRIICNNRYEIKIDGPIIYPGPQTAIFLRAFEGKYAKLKVLKISNDQNKAEKECRLYFELNHDYGNLDCFSLVPVKFLSLNGTYHNHISPEKSIVKGILMPMYSCSLSHIGEQTFSSEYAIQVFYRICSALEFINSHGWIHGDVKSSNIFIDSDSQAWLGDYGSSCKVIEVNSFTGGTLKYQILEVQIDNPFFDKVGLCLSLLEGLGIMKLNVNGNELKSVRSGIESLRENDEKLGSLLNSLLPSNN